MTVTLNHTIVPAADHRAAARFSRPDPPPRSQPSTNVMLASS